MKTVKKKPNPVQDQLPTKPITPSGQNKGLPDGWRWVRLGEFCEVITGTTPPKDNPKNYGNDIPFFKPPHLWDTQIYETEEKLSTKGAENARVVPPNTVLVTCIGNLGRTGFVKKTAAFNQQINAILENESIDGKYIFYQAQSPLFKRQLEKLATGTTVSIVNKGNFETIEIPLPPKAAQHAIVSKIEELLSELDKGKQQLETAQQQLKIYRQAVLKWAFEGKLSELGSVGLKDDRISDVAAKKEILKSSNPKNPNSDNELPKGWRWVKLIDVSKVLSGYAFMSSDFIDKGVAVIKIANVGYSEFELKAQQFLPMAFLKIHENFKIVGGDLLIALTRPITNNTTKVCKYPINSEPALLNQRVASIKDQKTSTDYIFWYFQTDNFKNYIRSKFSETLQPNLSPKDLELTPLPFPPIHEQTLIVQEIESRLSVCDKVEETITTSLAQAETLRQSILKQAFEGKLV
jgi:type I restriction enzyme, S subunit